MQSFTPAPGQRAEGSESPNPTKPRKFKAFTLLVDQYDEELHHLIVWNYLRDGIVLVVLKTDIA